MAFRAGRVSSRQLRKVLEFDCSLKQPGPSKEHAQWEMAWLLSGRQYRSQARWGVGSLTSAYVFEALGISALHARPS